MVRIIADSTCDLPDEMMAEMDITVIPLKVSIGGKTYDDKSEITTVDLFRMVQELDEMPVTAAPSPEQYRAAFAQAVDAGDSVLCFTISSQLSGSYQSACVAANMVQGKVDVIDTRTAAEGSGMAVLQAWRMIQQGAAHEAIAAECRRAIGKRRTLIVLDTMEYLRRGGRISSVTAKMASVLNIKPIINVNHDGTNSVFHKSRSYSKAMDWVLDYVIETARDLKNQTIGVGYSSVCQPAKEFIARLSRYVQVKEIILGTIGSVVGTHIGPDAFGVFWEEQ